MMTLIRKIRHSWLRHVYLVAVLILLFCGETWLEDRLYPEQPDALFWVVMMFVSVIVALLASRAYRWSQGDEDSDDGRA